VSLHARIKAAILARQERAQAALATFPGVGRIVEIGNVGVRTGLRRVIATEDLVPVQGAIQHSVTRMVADFLDEAVANHIAAESPAFVLRQCARDLKVLERHDPDDNQECYGCGFDNQEERAEVWPCPDIRDLAAAYAISTQEDTDHDG
jgi:hypothetical protein